MPEGLVEMMPWIDTLHFEVPGRDALRWALSRLPSRNHATLLLRRPFSPEALIEVFREAPCCACLRTLTLKWPPGMGRRTRGVVEPSLPAGLLAELLALPACRHLTNLGSHWAFSDDQQSELRAAGVVPVLARDIHWPHALPPAVLAYRRQP